VQCCLGGHKLLQCIAHSRHMPSASR
jgi:hypothetical protein